MRAGARALPSSACGEQHRGPSAISLRSALQSSASPASNTAPGLLRPTIARFDPAPDLGGRMITAISATRSRRLLIARRRSSTRRPPTPLISPQSLHPRRPPPHYPTPLKAVTPPAALPLLRDGRLGRPPCTQSIDTPGPSSHPLERRMIGSARQLRQSRYPLSLPRPCSADDP